MGLIIGLVGYAGVGKSTLAKALTVELEKTTEIDATVYSFGKALRDEIWEQAKAIGDYQRVETAFPDMPGEVKVGMRLAMLKPDCIYSKPTEPEIRLLLQWWGTDYRRKQDPQYWLKRWAANLPDRGHVIVDDARFGNEAELIRLFGGKMIRLERNNADTIAPAHASERLDDWWDDSKGIRYKLANTPTPRFRETYNARQLLKVMNAIGWS